MKGVISEKIYVDCNTGYTPTSNVQKRCPECKIKKKKNDNGQRKESQGKETEKLHRITEKFSDRMGRASESDISQASTVTIVKALLAKRQEHVAAVADIQETLRNLQKYAGVEIPGEDMLAI